jgi:uncharacterized protein
LTAVDTNILIYAHRVESPWHLKAHAAMTLLTESGRKWGIPWPCAHEFFSVVTNSKIHRNPTPPEVALSALEAWAGAPAMLFIGESPTYMAALRTMVVNAKVSGAAIHDARIYAICLSHGVRTLWSADRDFSRFGGIDLVNPLREARF